MNREIKFRVWFSNKKEMREVAMLRWENDKLVRVAGYWEGTKDNGWTDFDPENNNNVLMQFTGLKDKNGKEIYEGDIIASKGNPRLMVTRFDDHYGAFIFENPNNHIDCEIIGLNNKHGESLGELVEREVIGNIYENPELLTHNPSNT